MPISSGANGTPNSYFNKALEAFKKKPPSSPPRSPPPQYRRSPPPPRQQYRYPQTSRYGQPRRPPPPPSNNGGGGCGGRGGGCGGGGGGCGGGGGGCGGGGPGGGFCGPPVGHEGAGPCCCFCGGGALYSTDVAGANAGCFQGGMFSSKNPAYPAGQSDYQLQNTGRHRCGACVAGTVLGLLLIGLILGLVLALDPYLKNKTTVSDYLAANPGAQQVGNYILVHKDTYIDYYKVNGAEEPCNQYNNNSAYPLPTAGTQFVSGPATTDNVVVTDPALDLLPDCDTLTTEIVFTYSELITGPTTTTPTAGAVDTGVNLLILTLTSLLAGSIAAHLLQ